MPGLQLANTNQIAATAGYAPRLNLGEALQLQVPQLYADRSFAQQTRSADLAQEAEATRQSQQKGANIVQGVGTVGQLGLAAVSNWDKLKAGYNGIFGPSTTAAPAADAAVTGSTLSAAPVSAATQDALTAGGIAFDTVPGATTGAVVPAATTGSEVALGGGGAAASSGFGAAAASAGGGAAAGGASGLLSAYTSSKLPVSRGAQRGIGAAGGIAAGAGLGLLVGGPVGAVAGGLIGGLTGGSVCVCHEAAYGDKSVEVAIVRQFRDRYLDTHALRAYYTLYEPVAQRMRHDPPYRSYIRHELTDKLVRYGAQHMRIPYEPLHPGDTEVAEAFLGHLRVVGKTLPAFRRANGEVI